MRQVTIFLIWILFRLCQYLPKLQEKMSIL